METLSTSLPGASIAGAHGVTGAGVLVLGLQAGSRGSRARRRLWHAASFTAAGGSAA